jgi:hypothetical protein
LIESIVPFQNLIFLRRCDILKKRGKAVCGLSKRIGGGLLALTVFLCLLLTACSGDGKRESHTTSTEQHATSTTKPSGIVLPDDTWN